jgi:hypothetical protein
MVDGPGPAGPREVAVVARPACAEIIVSESLNSTQDLLLPDRGDTTRRTRQCLRF